MRVAKVIAAATVAAAVWASPGAAKSTPVWIYLPDGVKWRGFDESVQRLYLIGVWDGFAINISANQNPTKAEKQINKCVKIRKYSGDAFVKIVDNYYKKTKKLQQSPAEALLIGLAKLCVPEHGEEVSK